MTKTKANTWLEEVFKNDANLIFLNKKKRNLARRLQENKSRENREEISPKLAAVKKDIKARENELKRDLEPHLASTPLSSGGHSSGYANSSGSIQVSSRQF